MLLALAVIALAGAGVAIAYFLTHRDTGSSVTTVVTTTGGTAPAAGAKPMPQLTGKKLADAQASLAAFGLRASVTRERSTKRAGTVIAQAPTPGTKLTAGSSVTLVVAQKNQPATTTGAQSTTTAPTTTGGTTTTSTTTTTATTTPTTTAAAPPPTQNAKVPDVSNQTEAAAVQALNQAGILASLFFVPSQDPLGTVEQQAKPAGTTVPARSHLQINVSRGPGDKPQVTVPSVIGQSLQQALGTLNGAHLRLIFVKVPVTSRTQAGKVVQQSPLGGGQAPQNAQVAVFLGAYRA